MNPRHRLWALAVATALVLAGQVRTSLHASPAQPNEIVSLPIRLSASDGLTPFSKKALTTEAAAIWRQSGIDLHWLTSEAADPSLRVLVTPHAMGAHGDRKQWTLGELLRFDNNRAALAVVSIAGAQRIVSENQRLRFVHQGEEHDYRLGLVLGRAVAHEIGHYLLRTNTHAVSGLMRATIDAREFAATNSRPFGLDAAAQAHLAQLAAAPLSQAPFFSYTSR